MRHHHVDVRRAVRVATHDAKQLRRRARGVDGVLSGLETVEPELAVRIGTELAAEVVAGLVFGVVGIVFAVGAGLPHVKHGVGDALARLQVADDTVEEGELAVFRHVLDDASAKITEGSVGGPKGSEDGG